MSTPSAPITEGERILAIDALRGFALVGILVVNMAAFRAPVFGETELDPGLIDRVVTWLIAFGFEQKFYVLFSFLFGYGLSAQMFRAAERRSSFVPRFLRRLLGLLLIGLAHAVLLYTGDILVTYALLGVVLLLMRNVPSRVLLSVAAGLVLLSALTFALSGTVFATGDSAALEAGLRAESQRGVEAYRGTPAEVISERVRTYPETLGFALVGQGPTALAMFLAGLWAGRRRLFERVEENLPLLRRVFIVGLIVGVPGAVVWATERAVSGFAFDEGFFLAASVDFLTAPFLTAVYVVAITLLYRTAPWRHRLAFLVPVGRTALSNYLFQSLLAALIFTGYGLGLYGRFGAAVGLLLAFGIFAVQIPLSAWWMSRFAFGPAEWVLRSFTYASLQPIRVRVRVPRAPQEVRAGKGPRDAGEMDNRGVEVPRREGGRSEADDAGSRLSQLRPAGGPGAARGGVSGTRAGRYSYPGRRSGGEPGRQPLAQREAALLFAAQAAHRTRLGHRRRRRGGRPRRYEL